MELFGEVLAIFNGVFFALSNIFMRKALDEIDKETGLVITLLVNNIINFLAIVVLYFSGHWIAFTGWASVIWFVIAGAFTSFVGRYLLLLPILFLILKQAGFKILYVNTLSHLISRHYSL